jgi:hypothetical protein
MTTLTAKVAGYYILDNPTGGSTGDGSERGFLQVERRSNGQWYDIELDAVITAFEIAPVANLVERLNRGETIPFDEPTEISVMIEDDEYRTFVPDPGECERVGLPIKRLRH